MTMVSISPTPVQRFVDSNGNALSGGQLFTYQSGTTTKAATYTDDTGNTQNTNPIILNQRGEASVWLSATQVYKFVLATATDTDPPQSPIWTEDGISSNAGPAVGNMTDEKSSNGSVGFVAGVDFTAGTSTTLTLSQNYGSSDNLWVYFDAGQQGNDTFSLGGTNNETLTFNAPIPLGTQKVYVKGGTALTIGTPGAGTVTDASVAAGAGINSSKLSFTQFFAGSVARTVLSKLQESVSVFDFMTTAQIANVQGYVGTIDVSAAVQAAINSGATRIRCPAGLYLIKTTLNFTNRNSVPLIISGDGAYFGQNTGTTFLFQTGTWMADMTGCQFLHLEHMRWYSNGSQLGFSTLGLLYARSTTVGYAMYNTMFKMIIELPSSNGSSAGSIAIANNCAENFQCDQCWFLADTPYVSTLANELNLASVYTTIANTIFSNTDKSFRQCVFQSHVGFANLFYGEADATFDQCNWTPYGAVGAGVTAAISMNASAQAYKKCSNLRFTGDFEGFPSIAYLASDTQDIDIDCTTANTTASFVQPYTGTKHDGFRLKANQLSGSQTNLVLSIGAGVQMSNAEIYMASGQTLLDGNLTLNGGMVYGGGNDLSNSGVLSINPASSFRASYVNSTLTGSVSWTPGSVPGNSTVTTLVSVPNAVGGSSVRVMPPYGIPFCIASAYVTATGSVQLELSNVNGSASAGFGAGTWVVEVNKIYA